MGVQPGYARRAKRKRAVALKRAFQRAAALQFKDSPTLDPAPVPTQLQSIEQEANHSKRVCFSAIPCAPVTERRSCTTCCSTVAEAMPLVFAGASVAETIAAHVLARHFARCCSS